jgi:hypothetical protein
MPRDSTGKNRKWGQHKEKQAALEDINEETLMKMMNKAKLQEGKPHVIHSYKMPR